MPLCSDAMQRMADSFRFEVGRLREASDGRPPPVGGDTLILLPSRFNNMRLAVTRDGKIFMETEGERYRLRWQEDGDGAFIPTWQHRPSLGDNVFNSYETEIRPKDVVKFQLGSRNLVGIVKRLNASNYDVEHAYASESGRDVLTDTARVPARDIELLRPGGEHILGDILFREDLGAFMVIVSIDEEDTWGVNQQQFIEALRVKRDVENDMDERIPAPEPLTNGVLSYSRLVAPVESTAFADMEVPDVP